MPRKAAITPNKHIHTTIPYDLGARLELSLFSEVEGRVPQGAYQTFIVNCIREHFDNRELDLSPFLGSMPGEHVVKGSPLTLSKLLNQLEIK